LHFAPDTEAALEFAVALVNSAPGATKSGLDEIGTPHELTALLDAHSYSGRFDRDAGELRGVTKTRDRLRAVWGLTVDDFVVEVNDMLRDARALPFLARHDHFDWHWHATAPDAPLAERIRVEVSLAFADVIRSAETERMRECAADDCSGVLIDFSRNGSKRFCSVRCGNRMNMIAFRERQLP
jgi:predicted RNA-binding Zn ribbon-like protein